MVFLNPLQNHDVSKLKPESKVLFIFKVLYFKEQRTSAFPTHSKREEQHSKRERGGRNEEERKRTGGREGKKAGTVDFQTGTWKSQLSMVYWTRNFISALS